MNRFQVFGRQSSKNYAKTTLVLKCDIRKFFASINQQVLFNILAPYIPDEHVQALIVNIVHSFNSGIAGKGLPLGNLTSQLLVNIYMNEFDQFVKHTLKVKYYIRYADDFVVLSSDRDHLIKILPYMEVFLQKQLKLEMHPEKVSIATLASGIDFLGWVHFPDHRVLRTATKKRMFRRLTETNTKKTTVSSYLGMLSHGNTYHLRERIVATDGQV